MTTFHLVPNGARKSRSFVKLSTNDGQSFGAEGPEKQAMAWRIEDKLAYRLNVPRGSESETVMLANGHGLILDDSDPLEVARYWAFRLTPGREAEWTVEFLNIPPGRYFPRIARPHHQHPYDFVTPIEWSTFARQRADAMRQASALAARLDLAFQTVDPDARNLGAFGREFRDLLILAATEFEAQAKGILRANSYPATKRWTTNDYVKLEPAMRLADYGLSLSKYPWLPATEPFLGWSSTEPTASLDWYNAYNLVKHDREAEAHRATVSMALRAVAAVVVIGLAQFGVTFIRDAYGLNHIFDVSAWAKWSIGDTHGEVSGEPLQPIDYPF